MTDSMYIQSGLPSVADGRRTTVVIMRAMFHLQYSRMCSAFGRTG